MATYLNGKEYLDKPIVTMEANADISGTPKLVPVTDTAGAVHYTKAYPTKA
ncbi:MAG: hypothetical protein WC455_16485 [Dehalococcoidia bacterium]|jgi:hypothetical protein